MADALTSLRLRLEGQRREGVPFDVAWSVAIQDIPNSGWRSREVVDSTRPAWQRAYERRPPTARELALQRAAQALAELERERMEREGRLPTPGLPVPSADRRDRERGMGNGRGRKPRLYGRKVWNSGTHSASD